MPFSVASLKDTHGVVLKIEVCNRLSAQITDIQDLIEMANEENDESMVADIQAEFAQFKDDFEKIIR